MITDEWQAGLSLREAFAALQASPPDVDWRRAPRLFDNVGAAFNRDAARSAGQTERVSLPTITGKRLKSLGFERDVALGKKDRDALPFRRKIPACSSDLTINFPANIGIRHPQDVRSPVGVVPLRRRAMVSGQSAVGVRAKPPRLDVGLLHISRTGSCDRWDRAGLLGSRADPREFIACPGEMTCRPALDRGVALRDARQFAMAWSSDARPFAEQSGFGRIYGSYAAFSAGSASFSLRARTVSISPKIEDASSTSRYPKSDRL